MAPAAAEELVFAWGMSGQCFALPAHQDGLSVRDVKVSVADLQSSEILCHPSEIRIMDSAGRELDDDARVLPAQNIWFSNVFLSWAAHADRRDHARGLPVGLRVPFCCPRCGFECLISEVLRSDKPRACVLCFAPASHLPVCAHALCGRCWQAAECAIAGLELLEKNAQHDAIRVWGVSGREIPLVAGKEGVTAGTVRLAVAYAHEGCHPDEIKLSNEVGNSLCDDDLVRPHSNLWFVYLPLPWMTHLQGWADMGEYALVEQVIHASRGVGPDGPYASAPAFGMLVALVGYLLDSHTVTMIMKCKGPKEDWGLGFSFFLASCFAWPGSHPQGIFEYICDLYDVHPSRFR